MDNQRRIDLIKAKIAKTITLEEGKELDTLQEKFHRSLGPMELARLAYLERMMGRLQPQSGTD